MTRTISPGELHHGDVQALLALHVAAMRGQSPADACHVLPASALDRPDILFLTLREEDGTLCAIGALKTLDPEEGEVKSMRVAPAFLGTGAGRAMLEAIVSEARVKGMRRLRLETGRTDDFAAANALYDRSGFVPGERFGGYPDSPFTRFLCLDLATRLASPGTRC